MPEAYRSHRPWRPVGTTIAVAAVSLGVVTAAYLLRRALHSLNAARPGGIDITVFAAGDAGGASTDQIAAGLRDALTDVQLSGPSVVPGESAPQDFFTGVRGVVEQIRTPWGALLAVLSLLSVRNAYRVFCTPQPGAAGGPLGLTIEVAGFPRRDVSVTTVWGRNWAEITRQAACHVAAYVLPKTRVAKRPPWTPWRGIKLSPDLFYHFHEARSLARAGRLEEALYHFNKSMELDPLNPYIRIERATVQDELGLWVDALGSYVDVVTIESWYDRPVWRRYRGILQDQLRGGPSRFTRSPNGRAALQVARYRTVASLAAGIRLALQWRNNTPVPGEEQRQPARYREVSQVMARLRPLMMPYAELMMAAHRVPDGERNAVRERLREEDQELLRRVFQFAALEEAAAIERDYRWYQRRRWAVLPVSQAAIRIMPLAMLLQYHYVQYAQQRRDKLPLPLEGPLRRALPERGGEHWPGAGRYSGRWLRRVDAALGWPREAGTGTPVWPPDPTELSREVRAALGRRLLLWTAPVRRGWQEHYNAACAFALGMLTRELPVPGDDDLIGRHDQLVLSAVNELSRAAAAADSQFAGLQSVWLRRGDQDLDDLRVTRQYRAFIERFLPDTSPVSDLPGDPTRLVVAGHIARLVGEYAELRASFWRGQAGLLYPDTSAFGAEGDWWRLLSDVCRDYRDWRTRLRVAEQISGFSGRPARFGAMTAADSWLGEQPPSLLSLPPDSAPPEHGSSGRRQRFERWLQVREQVDTRAENALKQRNDQLSELGTLLERPPVVADALAQAAGAAAGRPVLAPGDREPAAALAAQLAVTWQAVARWVRCEPAGTSAGEPGAELGRLRELLGVPELSA